MSVRVMTAVFERYPNGGGEMLLALALADHASDDGSRIYPGIRALAAKTRQSERTVQYQLRRMQECGWLVLVSHGNGGRSMASEYRIAEAWLKGADFAPFQNGDKVTPESVEKGADFAPFVAPERVQSDDTKGCNLAHKRVQPVAPAYNHHRTIIEPSEEKTARKRAPSPELVCPDDVVGQTWADWLALRKAKRAPVTATVVDGARVEAAKAGLSLDAFLSVWCVRGTQGLQAAWLTNGEGGSRFARQPAETAHQRMVRERAEQFAPGIAHSRPAAQQPVSVINPEILTVEARHVPVARNH